MGTQRGGLVKDYLTSLIAENLGRIFIVDVWIRAFVIVLGSVLGSGGLWAYLQSRDSKRSATDRLMMGIAYEHITTYGIGYINRGYITKDEYEELMKYFYKPYKELGGNGVAERVMNEVNKLPFHAHDQYAGIFTNREQERFITNVRVVTNPSQHASAE
jgi:hypothetical protein